jgi:hypothetical protein
LRVVEGGDWLDLAVRIVHVGGAVGLVSILSLLTFLSWRVAGSSDRTLQQAVQGWRRRLLAPLWAAVALQIVTGVYNYFNNVPFELPAFWDLADVTVAYGEAYVVLLVAKLVLVAQVLLGLTTLSRRSLGSGGDGGSRWQASDVGAALVITLTLVSGFLLVITAGVLGYVHQLVGDRI